MGTLDKTLFYNWRDPSPDESSARALSEIIRGYDRIPDTGGFQNAPDDFKNK